MDLLGVLLVLRVVWFQGDVALQRLESLFQLAGEAVEHRGELFLLLVRALTPVGILEFVNHGLVHLIDYDVQGGYRFFRHLSEKDLAVVGAVGVHGLARLGGSQEVHSLAFELDLLSVGDEELLVASDVLDFSRLRDLVGSLVVDKQPWGSNAVLEVFSDLLEVRVSEDLLAVVFLQAVDVGDSLGHPLLSRCK